MHVIENRNVDHFKKNNKEKERWPYRRLRIFWTIRWHGSNPIQRSELTGQNLTHEVAHTCPPPGTLSYAVKK